MCSRRGKRFTGVFLQYEAEIQTKKLLGHIPVETLEFCDVQRLDLGFREVPRIEHLWEFTNLTTLHLNNNCILKIEGLSSLSHLTDLDLSSNNIMKIEGLESLKKLEVLNLSNNKISVLENMDFLDNLVLFHIGDNNLKDLNQVMYLRKLKNISTLNLSGNPLSEEDDYKLFVVAFFPDLKHLDYKYVRPDIKKEASEKFHLELEKLYQEDLKREKKAEAVQAQLAELQLHEDAFVEYLNGSYLLEQMYKDDPLRSELQSVPEIADQQESFRLKMTGLCVQLFDAGLIALKQRQAVVNSFFTNHSITKEKVMQKQTQLCGEFEKYWSELKRESASTSETLKVGPNDELNELHKHLLTLEFKLTSKIEKNIKKLDVEITEMITAFIHIAQEIFAQCRDLEDEYHEKVKGILVVNIENVEKDQAMPKDVKMLCLDKETVMGAVSAAHENHLITIQDREAQLITSAMAWKSRLIKKLKKEDLHRNRTTLEDFITYVEHYKEKLQII